MIYVDNLEFQKGKKFFCHMFADTLDELHEFALQIGRKRCWYHNSGPGFLHYDLDEKFRTLAIRAGAIVITTRDAVMAKKLSKSIGEYLDANGWSSKKFVDHAKHAFDNLKAEIEVGRSVIYIRSAEKMIKAYVHHNGRTNEYVTFTNEHGKELLTVHCSIDPADFTASIQLLIS